MFLSIIKRFWREIIIAILVIAVAISAKTCQRTASDKDVLQKIHDDTVKVFTNKNKELINQIQTHQLTIAQLKDDYQQLGLDKKKLENQVGNLNNLVGYWKGKAYVKDTFTVANHDTVFIDSKGIQETGRAFDWTNKYLTISGFSSQAKTFIKYDYSVDFTLIPYRQKHGFLGLGKSTLVTDLHFSDPNIKVKEFQGILIKEPKKPFYETKVFIFTIGLVAGTYLTLKL